jgi:predicted heme/steroid binding protein
MDMKRNYTRKELLRYDGDSEIALVAYQGVVYDVSNCPHWRTGLHEGQHFAGQDLTAELVDAPHSTEVFTRPGVMIVGRLVD